MADADRLRELGRNPFNLGLVADLLKDGVEAAALASVTSRGQLLERFWDQRVDDLGLIGLQALGAVTTQMLDQRAVVISAIALPPTATPAVERLLARGVLVEEGAGRLSFRHHVLFDYAVARVALEPDETGAFARLAKAEAAGLLLAPALGYWIERHFRRDVSSVFWRRAIRLIADPGIDPVIRVETSRLVAELVRVPADFQALLVLSGDGVEFAAEAIVHMISALQARASESEGRAAAWAMLARDLRPPSHRLLHARVSLVHRLLEAPDATEVADVLSAAALNLMDDAMARSDGGVDLTRFGIGLVTRTYAADPDGARLRLAPLLEPDRLKRFGSIEAPQLANEIQRIAAADPDFAACVYETIFTAPGIEAGETTSLNPSWILNLTSTAGQDFQMARYALGEAFPGIQSKNPDLGARILGRALTRVSAEEWSSVEAADPVEVPLEGGTVSFRPDHSSTWAWDIEGKSHDDYAKIYRAARDWAPTAPGEVVAAATRRIIENGGPGIVWRAGLAVAAGQSEAAVAAWDWASSETLLEALETRQVAIRTIAAAYPHLGTSDRQAFEDRLLAMPFDDHENPAATRRSNLGTVFAAIGAAHLQTDEAKAILSEGRAQGLSLDNNAPFSVRTSGRALGPHEWIRGDIEAPPNAAVLSAVDGLEALLEVEEPWDATEFEAAAEAFENLSAAWRPVRSTLLRDVDALAADGLARAGGRLIAGAEPEDDRMPGWRSLLVGVAGHPCPETGKDTEADYARGGGFGVPSPRTRAVGALFQARLIETAWDIVGPVLEEGLTNDPHPAVRAQVAQKLALLGDAQPEILWRLVDEVASLEPNPQVVAQLFPLFGGADRSDLDKVEAALAAILDRFGDDQRLRRHFPALVVDLAVVENRPAAQAILSRWLADVETYEASAGTAVRQVQDEIVQAYDIHDPEAAVIRSRAQNILREAWRAVEPDVRAWPIRGGEPTAREIAAIKQMDTICDSLYYGVGAVAGRATIVFTTDHGARAFLDDLQDLIRNLAALGTPRTVHHLLEMLKAFLPSDPGRAFDLMAEALLRTTGVARYEHESMGAALFVEIVGVMLADHRILFEEPSRRGRLIDCLAVFVDAGWPEARRLFQSLPELLA